MENLIIRNGVTAGIVAIFISLGFYFMSPFLMAAYYTIILFGVSSIYMYKSSKVVKYQVLNGQMSFSQAFKSSWLVFVFSSTIMISFVYLVISYISPNVIPQVQEAKLADIDYMENLSFVSEEQLDTQRDYITSSSPFSLREWGVELPTLFLFLGAVIALILALIFKTKTPKPNTNLTS